MLEIDPLELADRLRASLDVPRWVDEVMSLEPFSSLEDLLSTARNAATPLSSAEVDKALASHGPIGDTTPATDQEQTFGRHEQNGIDSTDQGLVEALNQGNAAYKDRFARMFLIRAHGRTGQEILAAMSERLLHDDATEIDTIGRELRDIALLRLESFFPPTAKT